MNRDKYEFSNHENFDEVYKIAKLQFKKIIKNFNQYDFKDNFEDLFYGGDSCHKLFLRKNGVILCGTLAFLFEDFAFCDIFFWNELHQKTNTMEFRYFCERFFRDTNKIGIKNMIVPMDKSRSKHDFFKKYCQKLYFTKDEYDIRDKIIENEYKNHYLLKVNYEDYFKKSKQVKRV